MLIKIIINWPGGINEDMDIAVFGSGVLELLVAGPVLVGGPDDLQTLYSCTADSGPAGID